MKICALFLFLLCTFGAWYGYERFCAGSDVPDVSKLETNMKIARLEERTAELFPTKISDRNAWFSVQKGALSRLSRLASKLDAKLYSEILAEAEKKFPQNYDAQFRYAWEQEGHARAYKSSLDSFGGGAKKNGGETIGAS